MPSEQIVVLTLKHIERVILFRRAEIMERSVVISGDIKFKKITSYNEKIKVKRLMVLHICPHFSISIPLWYLEWLKQKSLGTLERPIIIYNSVFNSSVFCC